MTTSVTDEFVVVRRSDRLDAAILHTQAKAALIALGWKPAIEAAAVAAAAVAQGVELTLEQLIFEAPCIGYPNVAFHGTSVEFS